MTAGAVGHAWALIDSVAPLASHRLTFDRDGTDSFVLTVQRLPISDGAPVVTSTADLHKNDLLPLLPRGSQWAPAIGWRSFVVLPFDVPGICAAAIGVEAVVPHASRGAFPIMRAFLLPSANISIALSQLAAELPGTRRISLALDRRRLVESSDARSPVEHEPHEGAMLRAAADAWRFGEPTLLRTLMLSDDQAPWPRHWSDKLREMATVKANRSSYLIATVPAIRAGFSLSTRLTLLRKEILG